MSPRDKSRRVTPLRLAAANENARAKPKPATNALAAHRATCCAGCKTVTLRASMTVWESEDSRLDGKLVCAGCESALTADEHDQRPEHCDCRHCERARAERQAAQLKREAETHGGLRPEALALLGLSSMLTDLGLPTSGDTDD